MNIKILESTIFKKNFFWEALLSRNFPVEIGKERHGHPNSYMPSLRCLLVKVFLEMYCPWMSSLRWKSFSVLPWFMEKGHPSGSWQITGCFLMLKRQDHHAHPILSLARQWVRNLAQPPSSQNRSNSCCWRTMDSQKQQGFPHRKG